MMQSTALVITGLAALILGGRLLVDGAVQLARFAGITERVIGLTIVAAGTSAPELAASIAAARKGHAEIAVANLLGSNIFNLLGILGLTALVTPVPVSPEILRSDAWWMPPAFTRGRRVGSLLHSTVQQPVTGSRLTGS